jgi:formate C-acetyltransferase
MDKNGPTAVVDSLTKPDYTLVACGTVVNQKFPPSAFASPEQRARLAALIRVYFARGGQEMQINVADRQTLLDAMEHPEKHSGLIVRVSGFSAYFTSLGRDVQEDIISSRHYQNAQPRPQPRT